MSRRGRPDAQAILALALLLATGTAIADEALARRAACTACHAVERRLLGPAFRQVSERYRGDAEAPARLAARIREGGSGTWGAVPMPPQPALRDEEVQALVAWILAIR